jgi:hypothetical protein
VWHNTWDYNPTCYEMRLLGMHPDQDTKPTTRFRTRKSESPNLVPGVAALPGSVTRNPPKVRMLSIVPSTMPHQQKFKYRSLHNKYSRSVGKNQRTPSRVCAQGWTMRAWATAPCILHVGLGYPAKQNPTIGRPEADLLGGLGRGGAHQGKYSFAGSLVAIWQRNPFCYLSAIHHLPLCK